MLALFFGTGGRLAGGGGTVRAVGRIGKDQNRRVNDEMTAQILKNRH
jgi:hypothetical protein